ncbi:hypothetical protein [Leifsonia aquatica]|uniref:hypothetical protein n=1 Tax=Leifsonia aquatica TaxID=144185 RepID=UPI00380AEDDA
MVSTPANDRDRDDPTGRTSREVMRQLVKTGTMPASFLNDQADHVLVSAMRAAPLYAVSVEKSLLEALAKIRLCRAQAQLDGAPQGVPDVY